MDLRGTDLRGTDFRDVDRTVNEMLDMKMEIEDFFSFIEDYMFPEDEPEKADIIFVPGSTESEMAEKAAELYRAGYAPLILPSGGHSVMKPSFSLSEEGTSRSGDFCSEWEYLSSILKKEGVPPEAILREDRAGFTWQNALFSAEVLEKKGICIHRAIICCKTWHARRCLLYYRRAFPDVTFFLCCSSPDGIRRENWRENAANISVITDEIRRLTEQFSGLYD